MGLTPMERELLQTVDRLQAEATLRETRLTERIEDLTRRLDTLTTVCATLEKLLAQE